MKTRAVLAVALLATLAVVAAVSYHRVTDHSRPPPKTTEATPAPRLVGRVSAAAQPLAGARVRIKGRRDYVLTDADGRFALPGQPAAGDAVTAAKEGYLIASLPAATTPLEIQLARLPDNDCDRYEWVDPAPDVDSAGACGNCHQSIYEEWRTSGHAQAAVNRRFQNLLDGSDWHGNPDRGWGLAQEYPEGRDVCWSCHAPSLGENAATFHLRHVEGVPAAGVHCDFCHKIRSTTVETAGLTHGRFAYELLRPAEGQIFFGPLDDVDRGDDAYSPLQTESRFCAACHEGTLFGVPVYTTWSEWLASPAAREGRQCQSCHTTPSGMMTNIAPTSGGLERDPQTLASHTFLPGGRETMLRRALDVSLRGVRHGPVVEATVTIKAHDVGHRLPTGFIDRHLLLIVEPFDGERRPVEALAGPQLPDAAGESFAGKPGRLFAKLLTDLEGRSPAPFWRAGVSLVDNRLTPDRPESLVFRFSSATARVRVRVVYRRFWQEVAESKQWPGDDIIVYDREFDVP